MTKIISIEGNIGSGKSTFLIKLKHYYLSNTTLYKKKYCFLEEPVKIWNTIKDLNGTSILELFYSNPEKYSFPFQMMAFITRFTIIKNAINEGYEIIFTERCLHTDKNIFAKMLYDSKKLNHPEFVIYNTWYDQFIKEIPQTEYIYLKTSPEIAFERIKKRSRQGENVSLDYIQKCHEYYENWFQNIDSCYIINANLDNNIDNNIDTSNNLINNWIKNCISFTETFTITFDGASRGNPGLCGAGFVIWLNNKIIFEGNQFLCTNNTNNFAEYSALIIALEKCISINIKNIFVKGDSNLVIKQLNKENKINSENLIPLYNRVIELLYDFNSFKFEHIYRDKNKHADKLANFAIDNRKLNTQGELRSP